MGRCRNGGLGPVAMPAMQPGPVEANDVFAATKWAGAEGGQHADQAQILFGLDLVIKVRYKCNKFHVLCFHPVTL